MPNLSDIQLSGEYITYLSDGEARRIAYKAFEQWADKGSFQPRVCENWGQHVWRLMLTMYLKANPVKDETELVLFEWYDTYGNPCSQWVTAEEKEQMEQERAAYYAEESKQQLAARHTEYSYHASFHTSHP